MAAVNVSVCRLCHQILSKKDRRLIFGETFLVRKQLNEVVGHEVSVKDVGSDYVCSKCFCRLNKLSKIEFDISNRVSQLNSQRFGLLAELRENYRQGKEACERTVKLKTPEKEKGRDKRTLQSSPTPRKVKVPGPLVTPESVRHRRQQSHENQALGPAINPRKRLLLDSPLKVKQSSSSHQMPKASRTRKEFTPGKVKVTYRSSSKTKVTSRLVKDIGVKDVVKCLAKGNSAYRTCNKIINSSLQKPMEDCLLNKLRKEMARLSGKDSVLCEISSSDLEDFTFEMVVNQVEECAPLLHKLIQSFTKGSIKMEAVVMAILLRWRNKKMSRLHHIIAQVLDHGGATDETIEIMEKIGLSVGPSSLAKKRTHLEESQSNKIQRLLKDGKKIQEDIFQKSSSVGKSTTVKEPRSCQILGDNVDITRTRSQMTKDRQRLSWHWFLLMCASKRVTFPTLPDEGPQNEIISVNNSTFIPNLTEQSSLEENLIHHIMHVLVEYIPCFKEFEKCIPKLIDHPYTKETSAKSDFAILDLLDKSENKTDEMICILKDIHEKYIPHTEGEDPSVIKKTVFGGDVLTNERAYQAQLAMLNSPTDFTRLQGVVHRPEGLHRMMNFLLFIYQRFYQAKSAGDAGTSYQLRNVMGRLDVSGSNKINEAYRAHLSFVEDTLDSYIVGCCMHMLGMEDIDDEPQVHPLFSERDQHDYIYEVAKKILSIYVKTSKDVQRLQEAAEKLNEQTERLEALFDQERQLYVCTCDKQYKTPTGIKQHLIKIHQWDFQPTEDDPSHNLDHIAVYRSSFMKCALILRDTKDAFKLGDGERILRNAKYEMLCADVAGHTKYRLWLFRFIAYCVSLLSPRQAMEYKWNCTSNISGGINTNIPNDNLVELFVQSVKKKIAQQGSNATYISARKATLALQVQDSIRANISKQSAVKPAGKRRPSVSKHKDVRLAVVELGKSKVFDNISGRQFDGFPKFKDVFDCVRVKQLCDWLTEKKKIASYQLL